ncbi:MAG TPA: MFS transporter [Candidatus Dormibacteraeota bacterium]|jgi:MFS family permease|nr:MFS transporter [Candidatus Dormibacteraeota bacterium]
MSAPRARPDPAGRLLLGQLVMFTGIAMLFPVVALYVRHRGGSALDAALFIAGPMVANTLVQVPAGRLADRIGRRPVLIGARLAYAAISLGLFADQGPLWFLAILRAGQGACSGAYAPALLAALIDLTPPDGRATRFSQLQRAELGGVLIGPLIGGAVATWRESAVFGVAGLAVLLGLGAVFRVPETRQEPVARDDGPGALAHTRWWRGRGVLVACLTLGCVGLVFTMYDVVWPQYLAARGVSTFVVGLSITLFAAPMVVLATPAGRLADRADRRAVLGVALTVVGACAATYPFLHALAVILVLGTVEACAFVLVEPSLYATLSDAAPAAERGRMMGTGGFFQFAGAAIGASVLGALYGVREGIPFWCGGAVLAMMAVLCAIAIPPRRLGAGGGGGDPEAGALPGGVVEDGDHPAGTDVDRPLLSGDLDEVRGGRQRREGLGDAQLDADIAPVDETQDGHGSPSGPRAGGALGW